MCFFSLANGIFNSFNGATMFKDASKRARKNIGMRLQFSCWYSLPSKFTLLCMVKNKLLLKQFMELLRKHWTSYFSDPAAVGEVFGLAFSVFDDLPPSTTGWVGEVFDLLVTRFLFSFPFFFFKAFFDFTIIEEFIKCPLNFTLWR